MRILNENNIVDECVTILSQFIDTTKQSIHMGLSNKNEELNVTITKDDLKSTFARKIGNELKFSSSSMSLIITPLKVKADGFGRFIRIDCKTGFVYFSRNQ